MPADLISSDVIIIGGGIAGLSAGAFLSGTARVTILESEQRTGYHASGRSAAVIIRNYGNAVLRMLNYASWPMLNEPIGICDKTLLKPRGVLMVARPQDEQILKQYVDGSDAVETCSAKDACARFPILREESIIGATWESDASDIDVDRLMQGYISRIRHNAGQIETDAQAKQIKRVGEQWQVTTPKGCFRAPILVNAAGAWADEIAILAGLEPLGLQPLRRSAAILPAPEGVDLSSWPMVADIADRWYAKPDAGRLMVSPADEDPVEPHDAWPDDMVLAEGLDRFERAVTIPVSRVEASWAGLRTFAPDRTPLVGFSNESDGFFWLAGQGGYGVQTSPALGRLAADLITGQEPALAPEVVQALSPNRRMTCASHY